MNKGIMAILILVLSCTVCFANDNEVNTRSLSEESPLGLTIEAQNSTGDTINNWAIPQAPHLLQPQAIELFDPATPKIIKSATFYDAYGRQLNNTPLKEPVTHHTNTPIHKDQGLKGNDITRETSSWHLSLLSTTYDTGLSVSNEKTFNISADVTSLAVSIIVAPRAVGQGIYADGNLNIGTISGAQITSLAVSPGLFFSYADSKGIYAKGDLNIGTISKDSTIKGRGIGVSIGFWGDLNISRGYGLYSDKDVNVTNLSGSVSGSAVGVGIGVGIGAGIGISSTGAIGVYAAHDITIKDLSGSVSGSAVGVGIGVGVACCNAPFAFSLGGTRTTAHGLYAGNDITIEKLSGNVSGGLWAITGASSIGAPVNIAITGSFSMAAGIEANRNIKITDLSGSVSGSAVALSGTLKIAGGGESIKNLNVNFIKAESYGIKAGGDTNITNLSGSVSGLTVAVALNGSGMGAAGSGGAGGVGGAGEIGVPGGPGGDEESGVSGGNEVSGRNISASLNWINAYSYGIKAGGDTNITNLSGSVSGTTVAAAGKLSIVVAGGVGEDGEDGGVGEGRGDAGLVGGSAGRGGHVSASLNWINAYSYGIKAGGDTNITNLSGSVSGTTVAAAGELSIMVAGGEGGFGGDGGPGQVGPFRGVGGDGGAGGVGGAGGHVSASLNVINAESYGINAGHDIKIGNLTGSVSGTTVAAAGKLSIMVAGGEAGFGGAGAHAGLGYNRGRGGTAGNGGRGGTGGRGGHWNISGNVIYAESYGIKAGGDTNITNLSGSVSGTTWAGAVNGSFMGNGAPGGGGGFGGAGMVGGAGGAGGDSGGHWNIGVNVIFAYSYGINTGKDITIANLSGSVRGTTWAGAVNGSRLGDGEIGAPGGGGGDGVGGGNGEVGGAGGGHVNASLNWINAYSYGINAGKDITINNLSGSVRGLTVAAAGNISFLGNGGAGGPGGDGGVGVPGGNGGNGGNGVPGVPGSPGHHVNIGLNWINAESYGIMAGNGITVNNLSGSVRGTTVAGSANLSILGNGLHYNVGISIIHTMTAGMYTNGDIEITGKLSGDVQGATYLGGENILYNSRLAPWNILTSLAGLTVSNFSAATTYGLYARQNVNIGSISQTGLVQALTNNYVGGIHRSWTYGIMAQTGDIHIGFINGRISSETHSWFSLFNDTTNYALYGSNVNIEEINGSIGSKIDTISPFHWNDAKGIYAKNILAGSKDGKRPVYIYGTVEASSTGAASAIQADNYLNIYVSQGGVVRGNAGKAIQGGEGDDTVTLDTGAQLVGSVDLAGGYNIVNLLGTGMLYNTFTNVSLLNVGDGTRGTYWHIGDPSSYGLFYGSFNQATINAYAILAVDGPIKGDVAVSPNSILTGNGTITGNVTNDGFVLPYNWDKPIDDRGNWSIPTNVLTIYGNYTQNKSGTLMVRADDKGNSDKLIVKRVAKDTGVATLNGGTLSINGQEGGWEKNHDYTVLIADGGIKGAFDKVESNLAFYDVTLTYDSGKAVVHTKDNGKKHITIAKTQGQKAVAAILDKANRDISKGPKSRHAEKQDNWSTDTRAPTHIHHTIGSGGSSAIIMNGPANVYITGKVAAYSSIFHPFTEALAIAGSSGDDTVTLDTGAQLVGSVDLAGGYNIVNLLGTGMLHNTFTNVSLLNVGDGKRGTYWHIGDPSSYGLFYGSFNQATINAYAILAVDGPIKGDVAVSPNSILTGNGTIIGDVANNGFVLPYDRDKPIDDRGNWYTAPNIMTIFGNYTQNKSGTLMVRADDKGNSDKLIVKWRNSINKDGGRAILKGGTLSIDGQKGGWEKNHDYTVLVADGGVMGAFDKVESNLAFYDVTLTYEKDKVIVHTKDNGKSHSTIAKTEGQKAVAAMFDKAKKDASRYKR